VALCESSICSSAEKWRCVGSSIAKEYRIGIGFRAVILALPVIATILGTTQNSQYSPVHSAKQPLLSLECIMDQVLKVSFVANILLLGEHLRVSAIMGKNQHTWCAHQPRFTIAPQVTKPSHSNSSMKLRFMAWVQSDF